MPPDAPRLRRLPDPASGCSATALVVMECGSAWPVPAEARAGDPANVHVIAQQADEPPSSLMVRVVRRIARLDEAEVILPRTAVLSCSDRTDRGTLGARALMARAILASIARIGRGKLVLSGRDSPATNHALLALADELKDRIRSSDVTISIELSPPVDVAAWAEPELAASGI